MQNILAIINGNASSSRELTNLEIKLCIERLCDIVKQLQKKNKALDDKLAIFDSPNQGRKGKDWAENMEEMKQQIQRDILEQLKKANGQTINNLCDSSIKIYKQMQNKLQGEINKIEQLRTTVGKEVQEMRELRNTVGKEAQEIRSSVGSEINKINNELSPIFESLESQKFQIQLQKYLLSVSKIGIPVVQTKNWNSLKETYQLTITGPMLTSLPKKFGQLRNITHLVLNNNPFNHFPMCILKLNQIDHLYIENIGITELPSEFYWSLPKLEVLWMRRNNITHLPFGFNKLKKMRTLAMTVGPEFLNQLLLLNKIPVQLLWFYIDYKEDMTEQEQEEFKIKCKDRNIDCHVWRQLEFVV